jgi:hypothetical protein
MEKKEMSILHLVVLIVLVFPLCLGSPFLLGEDLNLTQKLRQEIMGLNLINGLDLSHDQMEIILQSAEESKRLREEFQKSILLLSDDMEAELEKIKSYLKKKQDIPPSTAQRFHRISNEIKRKKREKEEKIGRLAGIVKENLEQHQLYQLQEFIPCIIPPKGELRIGQAGDNKGLVKNLERIRDIPYRLYERRKTEIINRTLQGLKLHIPSGVEIKEEELEEHIHNVFQRARNINDTDFEIQKENLAEELVAPIKPSHPRNSLTRKIEAFLLCPEIIPILEERL